MNEKTKKGGEKIMATVISKQAILTNLQQVAGRSGSLTRQQFRNSSRRKFASVTVEKYFGSFSKALKKANIASR